MGGAVIAAPAARRPRMLLASGALALGALSTALVPASSLAQDSVAQSTPVPTAVFDSTAPAVIESTATVLPASPPPAVVASTQALVGAAPAEPAPKADLARLLESEEAADIEALAAALPQEPSSALRLAIARRLGALNAPVSYPALSAAMSNDFDPKVRREAAVFVAGRPGGEALSRLEKYLFEEVWEAGRLAACAALSTAPARGGDPEAARLLARLLLEDPSLAMREVALRGLAFVKDRRVIPALAQAAAAEKEGGLRRDIEALLRELSKQTSRPASSPPKPRREQEASPAPRAPAKEDCGEGKGWCQCSTGQLEGARRCMSRDDCQGLYEDSYAELGGACRFNGRKLQ